MIAPVEAIIASPLIVVGVYAPPPELPIGICAGLGAVRVPVPPAVAAMLPFAFTYVAIAAGVVWHVPPVAVHDPGCTAGIDSVPPRGPAAGSWLIFSSATASIALAVIIREKRNRFIRLTPV